MRDPKKPISRQLQHWIDLKAAGKCRCGGEPRPNRTLCQPCSDKYYIAHRAWAAKHKDKVLAYHRDRQQALRDAGLCWRCSKAPRRENRADCQPCNDAAKLKRSI